MGQICYTTNMHDSWKPFLQEEFNKPYFKELAAFLHDAYEKQTIYPPKPQVFSAFKTPLPDIKVVIIGQDPYHGPRQAHGLSFSVAPGVAVPPSLQNIFKEIEDDIGTKIPSSGFLKRWVDQGVFLLNNTLTVQAGQAGSHRGKGWEEFTAKMIEILNKERKNLVFLLWGRDARSKKTMIDSSKHLVLESAHPSPFSANHGFFGNKHFSKTNTYLKQHGIKEIEW